MEDQSKTIEPEIIQTTQTQPYLSLYEIYKEYTKEYDERNKLNTYTKLNKRNDTNENGKIHNITFYEFIKESNKTKK
jgi:hypothetical protein